MSFSVLVFKIYPFSIKMSLLILFIAYSFPSFIFITWKTLPNEPLSITFLIWKSSRLTCYRISWRVSSPLASFSTFFIASGANDILFVTSLTDCLETAINYESPYFMLNSSFLSFSVLLELAIDSIYFFTSS